MPRRPRRFAPRLVALEDRSTPATLTVNSLADDTTAGNGLVTLREAVIAANTDTATDGGGTGSGADAIVFAAGLGGKTITLAGGQLILTRPVSITAPAGGLTVDGNKAGRIFFVNDGTSAAAFVTLAGLTLTRGRATDNNGGGAVCNFEALTLTGCTLTANASDNNGGAVTNPGSLTVTNSTLSQNTAAGFGGAMLSLPSGSLAITGSTVSGNTCGGEGGGVFADSPTVSVTNTAVTKNTTTGFYGGGLRFGSNTKTATLTGLTVTGNSSKQSGGGIYVGAAELTLRASTVSGNASKFGGGVYVYDRVTTIDECTISGNTASARGGGIYSSNSNNSTVLTVSNSTVSGNTAVVGGGGVMNYYTTVTLTDVTISGNAAGGIGGGVQNYGATTARNVTITGNRSDSDDNGGETGGGLATATGTVAVTNTIIAGNFTGSGTAPNDVRAKIDAGTNNIIGDANSAGGFTNGVDGNIVGVPVVAVIDTTLADNGGPTLTHAFVPGTPALGAGTAAGITATDQRGFPRPAAPNLNPDIGSYEMQVVALAPGTLPGGTVGQAYAQTFTASAANLPAGTTYTHAVANGALPPGLTLGTDGKLTGTPTAAGTFTFVAAATASTADFGGRQYTLTVATPPANTPPTITDVADPAAVAPGTVVGPLSFTVGDAQTPAGGLTVTALSNNTALVPTANVALGGSGADRTVTVTPAAGQTGTATITLTVRDAGGLTRTDTFAVTVTPVTANTPPTISDVADPPAVNAGTPAVGPLPFAVGDTQTPAGDLVVFVASDNPTLVPTANVALGGAGASRTVTVTPAAGASGTATITLTVVDGNGATAADTFTVTVNPAAGNTDPTISPIPNPPPGAVRAAVGPLAFTVADAETPAADLTLAATSSNPSLVPEGNIAFGGSGADRTVTLTPGVGQTGTCTVTLTVRDASGGTAATSFEVTVRDDVTPAGPKPVLVGFPQFGAGQDAGGGQVTFFGPDKTALFTATPFPGFTGGVRTAAADFNGDGVADLVVGTGPGQATRVLVLDGKTQAQLFAVDPFEATFTGGVYVAAGDVTGDGVPDLVITPDEGGGPRCRVFDGVGVAAGTESVVADFFGIDDPNFRGGARAAIGDVDGDGAGDLVVAAGFQGGPRVAGYSGRTLGGTRANVFPDFFAFEETLRNGIFVSVGDTDGDGKAEVIAGGGPGGGPRVTAFSGSGLVAGQFNPVANFFGGDPDSRGGIRVAVKNLDADARADLVVGAGTGAGSRVTGYYGKDVGPSGTPPAALDFDAFSGFAGGVFVG